MTLYIDTSLLVAAFTREATTNTVRAWLAEQSPDDLKISDWTLTEFSGALAMKARMGLLTPEKRAAAVALFTETVERSFEVLQVEPADFRVAARFADQYQTGIRPGDALHLAVAAHHGAVVCTLDKGMVSAAGNLGVAVHPGIA